MLVLQASLLAARLADCSGGPNSASKVNRHSRQKIYTFLLRTGYTEFGLEHLPRLGQ
jgi:hypothetical protein